jgi:hypothetical protein
MTLCSKRYEDQQLQMSEKDKLLQRKPVMKEGMMYNCARFFESKANQGVKSEVSVTKSLNEGCSAG